MLKKIMSTLADHQKSVEGVRKLRRLIRLGNEGLNKVFHEDNIITEPRAPLKNEEFLYRSIIYTMFYANFHSASWILKFERRMEETPFPYVDVELVLRAMLERLIHQYYIMTDSKRLASLFVLWRTIEYKRYYQATERTIAENPDSIAAIMEGGKNITPWSLEQEQEYNDAVKEWEALVIPKQTAEKSRSWSGLSMSRMAELSDMADFYKIFYKATSWYAHSLVHVSDFYLHTEEETHKAIYHARPTREQIDNCLFRATVIYEMLLRFTGNVLDWNINEKMNEIFDEKFSLLQYLKELLFSIYDRL
jgi:hypothetical protein